MNWCQWIDINQLKEEWKKIKQSIKILYYQHLTSHCHIWAHVKIWLSWEAYNAGKGGKKDRRTFSDEWIELQLQQKILKSQTRDKPILKIHICLLSLCFSYKTWWPLPFIVLGQRNHTGWNNQLLKMVWNGVLNLWYNLASVLGRWRDRNFWLEMSVRTTSCNSVNNGQMIVDAKIDMVIQFFFKIFV